METIMERAARYDGAVLLLPQTLRWAARELTLCQRGEAEELRLRVGQPLTALVCGAELPLGSAKVTRRELDGVIDAATGASAYSARESMRCGYITIRGGYRIGLCGTVLARDGQVSGYQAISSLNIRISREVRGAALPVLGGITEDGRVCPTLILSPPGGGKTTLLRDLVRIISEGGTIAPRRVAVADERSEIAALYDGAPQLDVGPRTDVLDSCPRADGIMLLLRAMNPEVIAFDEITAQADAEAARAASRCGVTLIASAHADSVSDISKKPLYRGLFEDGVFKKAVFITRRGNTREYTVMDREKALYAV